jgi:hypothetical protein
MLARMPYKQHRPEMVENVLEMIADGSFTPMRTPIIWYVTRSKGPNVGLASTI